MRTTGEPPGGPETGSGSHAVLTGAPSQVYSASASPNLFRLISNPVNMKILSLLSREQSNTTKLAVLLGMRQSHVSEHLRSLSDADLLKETWVHRGPNRNVKLYSLNFSALEIRFGPTGATVGLRGSKEGQEAGLLSGADLTKDLYRAEIPTVEFLAGRKKELSLLSEFSSSADSHLLAVWGLPGIGKTCLVAYYARRLPGAGKGVFWHDLREVDSLDHIISKLAVFLAERGEGRLRQVIEAESTDRGLKLDVAVREADAASAVLVFDDYEKCVDGGLQEFLSELGKRSRRAKTVVVSRRRPVEVLAPGASELVLEGLDRGDTMELLGRTMGRAGASQRDVMLKALGGERYHPMELRMLSQSSTRGDVPAALTPKEVEERVATGLLDALGEEEREFIEAASVLREPSPLDAFRWVCRPMRGLMRLLLQLERKGLVKTSGDNFSIHELVRRTAYEDLGSPEVYHLRAASYYLQRGTPRSALEALYHATSASDWETTWRIIRDSGRGFIEAGFSAAYLRILDQARTGTKAPDRALAWLHLGKGEVYADYRPEDAIRETKEAVRLGAPFDDGELALRSKLTLGRALLDKGRLDEAESTLASAEEVPRSEKASEARLRLNILDRLANLHVWRGELQKAFGVQNMVISGFEAMGDASNALSARLSRAWTLAILGEVRRALREMAYIRTEAVRMNMKLCQGRCGYLSGLCYSGVFSSANKRNRREAMRNFDEAIAVLTEVSSVKYLIIALSEKAIAEMSFGSLKSAREEIEAARRVRDQTESATALGLLETAIGMEASKRRGATRSEVRGHFDLAERLLEKDTLYLARTVWMRGRAEAEMGERGRCLSHLRRARTAFWNGGARRQAATVDFEILEAMGASRG